MIHGEDLILAINGTPLAASKSCSLSKKQSFIDVSSPTDGRWEACVPKTLSWSMSSDCLLSTMDAYKTLDAAWKAGTPLTIRFYNTEYDENETGTAYIENLDLQCTKNNLAKMSVSLRGSGPLTEYEGTAINIEQHEQALNAMYYAYTTGGMYSTNTYSNTAKVYIGWFTLTKRTMVKVTNNNDLVFFSTEIAITTKARNGNTILGSDYNSTIVGNGKIWLDAGTWYVVESAPSYTTPTYTAIS